MTQFRFRLATLQKLRESHRDEMRSKLAEACQAERLLQEQALSIRSEEAQLKHVQRDVLQVPATDINRLLQVQRYSSVLRGQLGTLEQQSSLLAIEIEKRRQALVEADQQVRVLDKLRERKLAEHRLQSQRAEVKVLDEIASRRREVDH